MSAWRRIRMTMTSWTSCSTAGVSAYMQAHYRKVLLVRRPRGSVKVWLIWHAVTVAASTATVSR